MKKFYTVVLDRLTRFDKKIESEPYECGWADEAIAFLRVEEIEEGADFRMKLQISPDGIVWVDEGTEKAGINKEGIYFMKTTNFGGWLRLVVEGDKDARITSYLALKG